MKNIVVLISGNGSNLQAIIDACKQKKINGTIRAVFSNKADAFGLERAREANIPAHALEASQFAGREAFDRELVQEIDAYAPDVVVLAGYMRILSPAFVAHYAGRLLNIHPSLLPKYPGLHTHRQVLENGDEEHGTEECGQLLQQSHGPIVSWRPVAERPSSEHRADQKGRHPDQERNPQPVCPGGQSAQQRA